jgi:hypothetical protein
MIATLWHERDRQSLVERLGVPVLAVASTSRRQALAHDFAITRQPAMYRSRSVGENLGDNSMSPGDMWFSLAP